MLEAPTAGSSRIGGDDVDRRRRGDAQARCGSSVQMVFQNPFASLNPRKKIGHALEEPLAINTALDAGASARARRGRCWRGSASAPEHYARYPHMFSGGQRQRVAIARALMLEPQARGRRRAGVGARRLDPGAGAEPADGPAGARPASPTSSSRTTSRSSS